MLQMHSFIFEYRNEVKPVLRLQRDNKKNQVKKKTVAFKHQLFNIIFIKCNDLFPFTFLFAILQFCNFVLCLITDS